MRDGEWRNQEARETVDVLARVRRRVPRSVSDASRGFRASNAAPGRSDAGRSRWTPELGDLERRHLRRRALPRSADALYDLHRLGRFLPDRREQPGCLHVISDLHDMGQLVARGHYGRAGDDDAGALLEQMAY